ncbi:MAG: FAD-binding protein [Bacteroidetes bacterium]|nr:FAD-binding protein [Bacteroidota bacterium]
MPVRVQFSLSPAVSAIQDAWQDKALKEAGIPDGRLVLRRKSLDARSRHPVFLYSVDVYAGDETVPVTGGFRLQNVKNAREVHIVGCGPAGLFAALQCIELGLKPVIFERGKAVQQRRRDLAALNRTHEVNPDSNYCFGEGGAGTYSDGKLYTRSTKRGDTLRVLSELTVRGAADDILWDAHPHIGTNKLPGIIGNIRHAILDAGGEIHFNSRLENLELAENQIKGIHLAGGSYVPVSHLILATGHSARDIFRLFQQLRIQIEAKPFALGVRIEHPQEVIDQIQYRCERGLLLPPASYSLVEQVQGRGVFSFCMCPGGIIAPAATDKEEVVVNGWSPSRRNGKFANSGFVVTVDELDFAPYQSAGELRAMEYQAVAEKKAWETNGNLTAPAQRMEDFIQGRLSTNLPECSYIPGISSRNIAEVLDQAVSSRIREALINLGRKMPAFRTNEAVLVGVESRTSSPVRIPRDKNTLQHIQISNLYPCAEGAGYAGGIMSAALDGMRCAVSVAHSVGIAVEEI